MICNICPRRCSAVRNVDGNKGGYCRSALMPRVARAGLHFYEEPFISGTRGSGTVFFSGCSLGCVYCQNEKISHQNFGADITVVRLSEIFRELVSLGAHNINLVTPTHFSFAVKQALDIYRPPVPIIYNTSGYELPEVIKTLKDYVDVYLFDLKYISSDTAKKYSNAADYPEYARLSIVEAYKQKEKCIFQDGLIKSGVVIRHLLLPSGTKEAMSVFDFVNNNAPNSYFSIMRQYVPLGDARNMPPLNRKVTEREYEKVLNYIAASDFENCYFQEKESADMRFIPNFDLSGV